MKPRLLHLQPVNILQTCKYNQNAVANQSKPTNLLQLTCLEAIYVPRCENHAHAFAILAFRRSTTNNALKYFSGTPGAAPLAGEPPTMILPPSPSTLFRPPRAARPGRGRRRLGAALLLLMLAASAGAGADPHERLRRIAALAERDHAGARTLLVREGPGLIAGAPYPVRIDYLKLLARLHADAGSLREARDTNELAITLAGAEGDRLNLALASLGRAGTRTGRAPGAVLGELDTLAQRYRHLDSPEFDAGLGLLRAGACAAAGRYDRALRHLMDALDTVRRHPAIERPREADIRLALAGVYADLGDPARALDATGAIRAGGAPLPPRTAALLAVTDGKALLARDGPDAALAALGTALDLARVHALTALEAAALGAIADAHLAAGRHDAAHAAARAALALAGEDDRQGRQAASARLGLALYGQGRQAEGLRQIDAALAAMRADGSLGALARTLGQKSLALERDGRFRAALAATREHESVTGQLALDGRDDALSALRERIRARSAARPGAPEGDAATGDARLREPRLAALVAALGAALATLLCAGVLWLCWRTRRTGRRLAELRDELAYRAVRDPLTGLHNRRSLQDRMRMRTGEAAARPDAADCFTLVDIDHFKRINDEHGHAVGDAVLVEVGRRLRAAVRGSDMVLRWGGEEFLVYSQGVTREQRTLLVRRILDAVAAAPVALDDGTMLYVSATAGAVSLPLEQDDAPAGAAAPERAAQLDWEQAIALADRALYKAKEAGRNRGFLVAGLQRPEGALRLDLVLPGAAA